MLSVILYGRNDSHGYNLHKRAAISLNAIAHLLSDADDEIIFVDYNTPDDLPTFPEAIADTLTAKAIDKLRVLRVRPAAHERFAPRTHLVALEPIARNVAIRRSNPANRWVLSTNTDMIFVPGAGDLTAVTASLDDGFYHLPRFELPEGLWETLSRQDPQAIIDGAKEWGERFHLNEIVRSGSDNLYDGPGDFQLFLRQDLFDIGGFHEEMIRGWHLDANIARRMRFKRGKVSSALDHLIAYHCDHTRMASAYHKADRVENDAVRFVDEVIAAEIPEQMRTWGLPNVEVEELKLGQASGARYLRALEAVIPGRLSGFLQTAYVAEEHGRLGYDPDHVMPYLLDLVSCIPQTARIGYAGRRRDTADAFARGWAAMGGLTPIQVPDTPGLAAEGALALPLAGWLDETDVFVFEVGSETASNQADLTPEDSAGLWAVDQAFKAAARHDKARLAAGRPARRAFIVNAIHNFFEPQVLTSMAVTLTPFSSRIRHGYIVDRSAARAASATPAGRAVMAALGSLEPPQAIEVQKLNALVRAGRWDQAGRVAAEFLAWDKAGVRGLFEGVDNPAAALVAVLDHRPSRAPRAAKAALSPEAGRGAASRLIRIEDWDDPEWSALAGAMFANRDHGDLFQREMWTWERVSLAQNLFRAFPAHQRPNVLVVGEHPERLAFVLAHLGARVDIADPKALAENKRAARDWRDAFRAEGWVSPEPVGLISDRPADFLYDAVLLLQNGLFVAHRAGAGSVLKGAASQLRVGGHLGLTATTQVIQDDERYVEHALPLGLVRDGRFARALADFTGLSPVGESDPRMTPRTFDRLYAGDVPKGGGPALAQGLITQVEAPGVWAFTHAAEVVPDWGALSNVLREGRYLEGPRRGGPAGPMPAASLLTGDDLAAVSLGMEASRFGASFSALQAGAGMSATPTAIGVRAAAGAVVVATADLGPMTPGAYELELDVRVRGLAQPGPFLVVGLVGVVGQSGLILEQPQSAETAGPVSIRLDFDPGPEGRFGVGLVIKSLGTADFDIVDFIIR